MEVLFFKVVKSFFLFFKYFTACIDGLTGGTGFSSAGASPGWSAILFYGVGGVKTDATK